MIVLRPPAGSLTLAVLALGLLALGLAGCETHLTSGVSGQVTLDGQPLAEGTITFLPSDGGTSTASGSIVAGKYQLDAPPGAKKVEILASKVVGQKPAYEGDPNSPKIDITESIIPAAYNTATTLTADLKAGSNTGVDFDLKSKP